MAEKKDFRVNLGDPVQLQFVPDDGRERLNARIIGHHPGKSLIITAPSNQGKVTFLKDNQLFVIRMLQGNNVYGFESSVLKSYNSPYPHIHLKQPDDVECITVRGSRRVETETRVSISSPALKDSVSASMLNTSATGALLQTRESLGNIQDVLIISMELEVTNIKKYLRVRAAIRNVSVPEDRDDSSSDLNKYGVQFLELAEEQKLIITAYVYEQIVQSLDD